LIDIYLYILYVERDREKSA